MGKLSKNNPEKKCVLIDDDETFCQIIRNFAASRGIVLDSFTSLEQMGSLGKLSDYAVAIVDYDLGSQLNGLEIAEYLPAFFGEMPMILVSGRDRRASNKVWPRSIKSFVHKDLGPDAILDLAQAWMHEHDGIAIRAAGL